MTVYTVHTTAMYYLYMVLSQGQNTSDFIQDGLMSACVVCPSVCIFKDGCSLHFKKLNLSDQK